MKLRAPAASMSATFARTSASVGAPVTARNGIMPVSDASQDRYIALFLSSSSRLYENGGTPPNACDTTHSITPSRKKSYFFTKFFQSPSGVVLAPVAHGYAETGAEEAVDRRMGAEAAESGDQGNGRIGLCKKRAGLLQADMQDLVQRRPSHRLAETQVEEVPRAWEALGERGGASKGSSCVYWECSLVFPPRWIKRFSARHSGGAPDDMPPAKNGMIIIQPPAGRMFSFAKRILGGISHPQKSITPILSIKCIMAIRILATTHLPIS